MTANQVRFRLCTTATQNMGLHNSRATRSGQPHVTQMYVRCTGQKTTGSSLSRPFATPHAPPHTLHTPGKPPRLACLLEGCEGSRRCEWVIPHPSLLMSDALSPLASIPGFGEAPVTPHASNTNLLPELFAHLDPDLRESSPPHDPLDAAFELPKTAPSWSCCFE